MSCFVQLRMNLRQIYLVQMISLERLNELHGDFTTSAANFASNWKLYVYVLSVGGMTVYTMLTWSQRAETHQCETKLQFHINCALFENEYILFISRNACIRIWISISSLSLTHLLIFFCLSRYVFLHLTLHLLRNTTDEWRKTNVKQLIIGDSNNRKN